MQDDQKNPHNTTVPQDSQQNAVSSQQPQSQVQPESVQSGGAGSRSAGPVSSPHKEMAPLSGMTEVMRPAEQAPEIAPEAAGVVEHSPDEERPQIPQEVMQAGVTHAKDQVVHHVEPQGMVQLPQMAKAQAVVTKKKNSVTDAAKWFAVFVLRQFDKIAYQKLITKS